jgi:hypothetical protein
LVRARIPAWTCYRISLRALRLVLVLWTWRPSPGWIDTGFSIVQGDDLYAATVAANPNGSTINGYTAQNANERALLMVLSGQADAMWIYGDQAANYHCAPGTSQPGWNCDLWNRREPPRPRSVHGSVMMRASAAAAAHLLRCALSET